MDNHQNHILNTDFNLHEVNHCLERCRGSSPGNDDISYEMIKNMSIQQKNYILDFYNQLYNRHTFPKLWTEALVIPILINGKNKNVITNYRPISLTSCLCKLLERMVNRRLVWYLERNQILVDQQYGFRRGRSTMDSVFVLDNYIKEGFKKKEHTIAIFFDLEKAYDTTWKYRIIQLLADLNIKGNMLNFIINFLHERKFKIINGNTSSNIYRQDNGLPQGTVLSVILLLLAINNITDSINDNTGIEILIYADDIVIFKRHKNLVTLCNEIQQAVDKIKKWTDERGFKLSPSKTTAMHFTKKRVHEPLRNIKLGLSDIIYKDDVKFLGFWLDKKLTWKSHIEKVRQKGQQPLNLIKTLSNYNWVLIQKCCCRFSKCVFCRKLSMEI